MANFAELIAELDAWAAVDAVATLWWRDDDAGAAGPSLDRLLALAEEHGVPLALAAIPIATEDGLARALTHRASVAVLQHGFAHRNHAPTGSKKCELATGRPVTEILDDLARGRRMLGQVLARPILPVLVPPWNRIDAGLLAHLPALGFRAISGYGARRDLLAAPGLTQTNCHVDPVDWRGSRGFLGLGRTLDAVIGHLRWRRLDPAGGSEPTGILTHHQVHDSETWRFLAFFLRCTTCHAAVRWLPAGQVFDLDQRGQA